MSYKTIYSILIIFISHQCIAQQNQRTQDPPTIRFNTEYNGHYAKTHLNGKVKSIEEIGYDLIERKGKIKKGKRKSFVDGMSYLIKRLSSNLTHFDESGNLLATHSMNKQGDFIKLKEFEWDSSNRLTKVIFHTPSNLLDSTIYQYKGKELYENVYFKPRPKVYNVDSVLAIHKSQLEKIPDLKVRHQMDSIFKVQLLAYANDYNTKPKPSHRMYISNHDKNGQLLEKYFYDEHQVKTTIQKFSPKYKDGRLIELYNESDSTSIFGEIYKYDDRGNQIENVFIEPSGMRSRIFTEKYDKNNNLIRKRTLSSNPRHLLYDISYEYDINNNRTKIIGDNLKGEKHIQTFKYDSNNNIIEENTADKHFKYQYKYDKERNWISKKKFKVVSEEDKEHSLIPLSIIERKISYHK